MVQIITDSAADFEVEELKDKNIICVPMKITFGETEYEENVNLTKDEFYQMLRDSEEFPKTAQPSPFEFETHLERIKENGDECVIITISSQLSGTYQNACLTKNMVEFDECYVVDSLNATGGQRILVEEAIKLRDSGKSAKEIADVLESLKDRVTLMACVDTLEYLYKGGRISKTAYAVGSFANIKPLIEVSKEGKVEVLGKTISVKRGVKTICENISEVTPDENYPMYIVYSHNRKNADFLASKLSELGYDIPEENIFKIGATIGAHVGEGACGYIYIAK